MTRNILILVFSILFVIPANCKIINTQTYEGGGTGPYKAVMCGDDAFPDYCFYCPEDLKSASANGKIPVILFANGGCTRSSVFFANYLTEIASYGYFVVANGPWALFEEKKDTPKLSMEEADKSRTEDAISLLRTLNRLQNNSEYAPYLDLDNVAAMGQSCGGFQVLVITLTGDERIKTTVVLNSGIPNDGNHLSNMVTEGQLKDLTKPIIYMLGGEEDIAYTNGADDYPQIDKAPVVLGNLPVGHLGTYEQPHGGSFAKTALLWLDYQLKGKVENGKVFRFGDPDNLAPGWSFESKNF